MHTQEAMQSSSEAPILQKNTENVPQGSEEQRDNSRSEGRRWADRMEDPEEIGDISEFLGTPGRQGVNLNKQSENIVEEDGFETVLSSKQKKNQKKYEKRKEKRIAETAGVSPRAPSQNTRHSQSKSSFPVVR